MHKVILMLEELHLNVVLPVPPKKVYDAWLNGKKHAAMTGSEAEINAQVGGKFTAWDGYIFGQNLELTPGKRILQSWRTTEFRPEDTDSLLEILFEDHPKGVKITLNHTKIPEGQSKEYKSGWTEFYFDPMKEYFKAPKKGTKSKKE